MIDRLFAERLIDKLSQFTEYNINIMDEDGIIIASRLKERVGTFHEVAFQLMKGDEDSRVVTKEDLDKGVKCGVNMVVHVNKRKEGVVGLSGDPREIMPVAKIVKMSVELMLEYESYKFESLRKYNLKEQLVHLILYSDDFVREDLTKYIVALNLEEEMVRVPILIECKDSAVSGEKLRMLLEDNKFFSRQDFVDITREGFLVIFKSIDCPIGYIMQDYKYMIAEYLASFLQYIRNADIRSSIYIGPLQNDIMYYRQAYLYCLWMQKNIRKSGSFYFYDYIVKYLESMASMTEFHTIFLMLRQKLGQKFIDNYLETIGALIENEYNLNKASDWLHVYKNTLVYRLDKIREILNMNPLSKNSDREFMECFYYYLLRK